MTIPVSASDQTARTPRLWSVCNDVSLLGLITQIRGQDATALTQLYQCTASVLLTFTRGFVRNRQDAEEVIQDVYLHVWLASRDYDPARGQVLSWLFMLCRSRALDSLRRKTLVCKYAAAIRNKSAESCDAGPHDDLQQLQQIGAIHQKIALLSPLRRRVIGLAFFRGLSHRQIASSTGLPLGTVKAHVRRALHVLRKELEPCPSQLTYSCRSLRQVRYSTSEFPDVFIDYVAARPIKALQINSHTVRAPHDGVPDFPDA
jgi:RNA polymerase sigma-70 factor (ECF subfamily)